MKHLIDITDLSVAEIDQLITTAFDIITNPDKYSDVCNRKKLATLFYEPSTRTRLSFTAAMMELGGQVLGFSDPRNSSVSKGETIQDTVRVVQNFADIIAVRHHTEGAPLLASKVAKVPIINAGDGSHAHPTQTLTDLFTIRREIGRIDNFTIAFCGDLKYGRTVHSLIQALSRYQNVKVILISPEELSLPSQYKVGNIIKEVKTIEEVISQIDILYMTRIQQERFTNLQQFEKVKDTYQLNLNKLHNAKPTMRILHPLPRVNEIHPEVDNDPRAAYFRQVENGKIIRMALIHHLLQSRNPN